MNTPPKAATIKTSTCIGRCGEASHLGFCARSDRRRRAVILVEVGWASPSSASRPRFGEFDADRPLAAPNHVDFAQIARGIDLQREGVRHLDVLHRPHLGAALRDVDDLAVDDGQNAAGIRPGANVFDSAILVPTIVVAGKILDVVVQARLHDLGSFLEFESERPIMDDRTLPAKCQSHFDRWFTKGYRIFPNRSDRKAPRDRARRLGSEGVFARDRAATQPAHRTRRRSIRVRHHETPSAQRSGRTPPRFHRL
jgi:hypothetical protein